jgi:dephospho-CoA kinase
VLRLGVVGDGPRSAVVGHLVALGASIGAAAPGPLDAPGVEIYDIESRPVSALAITHLVIRVHTGRLLVADADTGADIVIGGERHARERATDTLWRSRLVPFEANVRMQTRAPRARRPILADPRDSWADDAARLIARLHRAVGDRALRIDHIGSTSIPGLPAKDLVDIQVAVRDVAAAHSAAAYAREAGFVHVNGEWYGEDRCGVRHPEAVAVDADPGRSVNINFRAVTAPVWREALLFRDWLRSHDDERDAYAAMKKTLAGVDIHVDRYSEDKMPWIHAALARAETWALSCRWSPDQAGYSGQSS